VVDNKGVNDIGIIIGDGLILDEVIVGLKLAIGTHIAFFISLLLGLDFFSLWFFLLLLILVGAGKIFGVIVLNGSFFFLLFRDALNWSLFFFLFLSVLDSESALFLLFTFIFLLLALKVNFSATSILRLLFFSFLVVGLLEDIVSILAEDHLKGVLGSLEGSLDSGIKIVKGTCVVLIVGMTISHL